MKGNGDGGIDLGMVRRNTANPNCHRGPSEEDITREPASEFVGWENLTGKASYADIHDVHLANLC